MNGLPWIIRERKTADETARAIVSMVGAIVRGSDRSIRKVAGRAGVSPNTVCRILAGKGSPEIGTLARVCEASGVSFLNVLDDAYRRELEKCQE